MSLELDQLWVLRGLDEELAQIRTALAKFPGARADLAKRVENDRARLAAHQKTIADVQLKRREIEREIEAVTQQERKFAGQQALVKTNAEYQALTHEIAGCRTKRSDLETEVLVLLEDEENLAAEKPAIERSLAAAEAERGEQMRVLQADEDRLQGRAGELETARQTAMAQLSAATRGRYERVAATREGRAVVAIVKGACGGCFRSQPPQLLQEARRRDRVLTCDGCGRMLVLPPEGVVA